LVLEYYNYSENHYLFINDVNDIPYFIENKYDLPIIIELNLYETKSLKNIFNSIKERNLDDVIPIIKNRNDNGNSNLIAYSYIDFLLSPIELNQIQSNEIEINDIQKYYQYISDKIQNQIVIMDEKDNIEEYFNQLFKKINMININNIQKVKKNYYLDPHTYSIQKIIKKQIIEKEKANYLEYTTLHADFEDCGICMYCPSEPYEPADEISSGPIIDNVIYTNLKNILYN
jgi:hypothetical protein